MTQQELSAAPLKQFAGAIAQLILDKTPANRIERQEAEKVGAGIISKDCGGRKSSRVDTTGGPDVVCELKSADRTKRRKKLKAGSSKKVEGPRLHLLHSVAEGLPEMTYPASEEPNTGRKII